MLLIYDGVHYDLLARTPFEGASPEPEPEPEPREPEPGPEPEPEPEPREPEPGPEPEPKLAPCAGAPPEFDLRVFPCSDEVRQ